MTRCWLLTGVHGSPTRMRLANGHGPSLPNPEETVEVVELGSWRAVAIALSRAVGLGASR